jgi:hypothetical protein
MAELGTHMALTYRCRPAEGGGFFRGAVIGCALSLPIWLGIGICLLMALA